MLAGKVPVGSAVPPRNTAASGSKGSKVLVVNAGSSSIKFKIFTAETLSPGAAGLFDRIGDTANCVLKASVPEDGGKPKKFEKKIPAKDHLTAMQDIMSFIDENVSSTFASEVCAVGHRIVHGLDISQPKLLTPDVISCIQDASVFAPLHNPPHLQGIYAAQKVFGPSVPQVAVFDTAFHQTMPPESYVYGLPYDMYENHKIRRYGFHGTSHKYLVEQAAAMLGKDVSQTNVITCHLGNGSSVAAVRGGQCVDTSMGMTPLEGLLMGTRCGDIDPAVVLYIQNQLGLSATETDTLLNKKSGLLGLTGSNDLRTVIEGAGKGEARSQLGLDMFVRRVRKYIGAYMAVLDGQVDAVVFSAGIGENSALVRGLICERMQALGISVDKDANAAAVGGKQADISGPGARIRTLVIPTDEELSIAQQTLQLVRGAALAA
ncbi:hypothetical protein HYH02_001230 [Chlamydomonas schloesseri]|uniref:Probable acetate kinase n=1 Tax=Chlamydomonas schloesseri TaxID=2026947 RepID=A0A835WUZ0_9CHLO|nr:hypothetical protein HYH02_001230 [Chlamydomonas schloesseri]|eukprot:KAG2454195.1 hypothetical protein HYH02_001230 [Chlamydomonas schloesseri]